MNISAQLHWKPYPYLIHEQTRRQIFAEITKRLYPLNSGRVLYAGAARRHVHLGTPPRPPSGHRPGRRQAPHAHILEIGLHLAQPRSMRAAPLHNPAPLDSDKTELLNCQQVKPQFFLSVPDRQ